MGPALNFVYLLFLLAALSLLYHDYKLRNNG